MAREELGERLEALAALLRERELLLRRAQQSVRLLLRVGLLEQVRDPRSQVIIPLPQLPHLHIEHLEHRRPLQPQLPNEILCPLLFSTRQILQLATL